MKHKPYNGRKRTKEEKLERLIQQEEEKEELIRCALDPQYFYEKYIRKENDPPYSKKVWKEFMEKGMYNLIKEGDLTEKERLNLAISKLIHTFAVRFGQEIYKDIKFVSNPFYGRYLYEWLQLLDRVDSHFFYAALFNRI